jgi:hypothetical protein
MRKIVLSTVTMALIAASAPQAFAAQSQHRARKVPLATGEQFRSARNAVEQPSQPAWQYSGWSAPAGR